MADGYNFKAEIKERLDAEIDRIAAERGKSREQVFEAAIEVLSRDSMEADQ